MGWNEMLLVSIIPFLTIIVSVGVMVYFFMLLIRLVRAVERIADKMDMR